MKQPPPFPPLTTYGCQRGLRLVRSADRIHAQQSLASARLVAPRALSTESALDALLLPVMSSLTSLRVGSNWLGDEGAQAIGSALKESKVSKLENLEIYDCWIGPHGDGVTAIAAFCAVSASLTSLDLSDNRIGDQGAKAVADALRVNGSLTSLNLRNKPRRRGLVRRL